YETAYKLFKDYYYKSGRELLKYFYNI
ncbi:toxin, partial [Enterococcus faecium]|nr:toxin [Enterococcus faecium]